MAKKREPRTEFWQVEPEEHDFPAASDYLSLILPEATVAAVVDELRAAVAVRRKAKDLMRSSELPLLPDDDPEVAKDLKRVLRGESLSPVLLVRGLAHAGVPLIVADGYHRICASYHLSEDEDIPCLIAEHPQPSGNGASVASATEPAKPASADSAGAAEEEAGTEEEQSPGADTDAHDGADPESS